MVVIKTAGNASIHSFPLVYFVENYSCLPEK
jgi:hypothetical protein